MKPIFVFFDTVSGTYIVMRCEYHDWTKYDATWMGDPLGGKWLRPEVDIIDLREEYKDLEEALHRMAELYAEQL